jgi:MoaD family protein
MFAALRQAAGATETTAEPGTLSEVLDQLRQRYGHAFAERLAVSTVLVNGDAVDADAQVSVSDGSELSLLPPVSGGGQRDSR